MQKWKAGGNSGERRHEGGGEPGEHEGGGTETRVGSTDSGSHRRQGRLGYSEEAWRRRGVEGSRAAGCEMKGWADCRGAMFCADRRGFPPLRVTVVWLGARAQARRQASLRALLPQFFLGPQWSRHGPSPRSCHGVLTQAISKPSMMPPAFGLLVDRGGGRRATQERLQKNCAQPQKAHGPGRQ